MRLSITRGSSAPRHLRNRFGLRKALAVTSVAAMVGAGIAVATAASASAHEPSVSADCRGVSVSLKDYQPKKAGQANHVTVTVNGTTVVDQDFGKKYVHRFTFDNNKQANDWTVTWTAYDDAKFSGTRSDTSEACATKPKPDHDTVSSTDCDSKTVVTKERTREYVWDYGTKTWVAGPWSEWTVIETRPATPEELAECAGEQPKDKVVTTQWEDQSWPCGATTTTQTRTVTTTPFVLENGVWVPGTPVVTHETQTRDLLASEITACPAPEKPQPIVVQSEKSSVDCTSKERVVTTTTTTTDWVLNASKSAWVKAAPVVTTSTASFPTTAQECPTPTTPPTVGGVKVTAPPTVTPIVKGVKHEAAAPAAAPQLAYTGSESTTYGLTGLALLVLGSGLVLVTRKRTIKG